MALNWFRRSLVLLLVLATASSSFGQAGTFSALAYRDPNTQAFDPIGVPTTSDNGQYVTFNFRLSGQSTQGIHLWNSTSGVTTIAQSNVGGFQSFGAQSTDQARPTVNNSGQVAFFAQKNTGGIQGIYRYDGGSLTTMAENLTGTPFFQRDFDAMPSINNNGAVAVYASRNGFFLGGQSISEYHVLEAPGNSRLVLSVNGSTTFGTAPSLDDSGRVTFGWNQGAGGALPSKSINRDDHGSVTTIVAGLPTIFDVGANESGSGTATTFNGFNNATTFNYVWNGSNGTLFTGSGSDPFFSYGPSSTNNLGQRVFLGETDAGAIGLYGTYGDPNSYYIRVGDALDGSIVSRLAFDRFGLADNGSFVFSATLQDGRTGVYRYSLTPVPEPSVVLLLVACTSGFALVQTLVRIRRRCSQAA